MSLQTALRVSGPSIARPGGNVDHATPGSKPGAQDVGSLSSEAVRRRARPFEARGGPSGSGPCPPGRDFGPGCRLPANRAHPRQMQARRREAGRVGAHGCGPCESPLLRSARIGLREAQTGRWRSEGIGKSPCLPARRPSPPSGSRHHLAASRAAPTTWADIASQDAVCENFYHIFVKKRVSCCII